MTRKPKQHSQANHVSRDHAHGDRDPSGDLDGRSESKFWARLAIIVLVAWFVRIAHLWQTSTVPSATSLIGDAKGYFDWGCQIADGNWYGDETFYQAPLYPYFLATIISLFGQSTVAIRLVQTILGAVSVGLLGMAAKSLFCRTTGLVAAAMLAIFPAAIYYDGLIQKASLASFLLCGFLSIIAPWLNPSRFAPRLPSLPSALAAGATLGLLMLVRENTLLWMPLPIVWFWIVGRRSKRIRNDQNAGDPNAKEQDNDTQAIDGATITGKSRLVASAFYLVGMVIVLFPVAARNASLGGEWSPTTFQAGPNFYIGNNASASGVYSPLVPGHETPLHERSDAVRLAQKTTGREMSSREVSRFWFQQSWNEIKSNPLRWVQLIGVKTLMTVNYFEVPDIESMTVYREQSIVLLMFDRIWNFGTLCMLAAMGIVLTRGQWRRFWLWHGLTFVLIAATVGFFILGRYRFPLVALLIPFAAAGVVIGWACLRRSEFKPLVLPLFASLITGMVCFIPVHDVRTLDASSFANIGAAAAANGRYDQAVTLFRRAIAESPEMPEVHVNMGRVLMLQGDLRRAIVEFQLAQRLEPNLADVDFFLATALERVGEIDAARYHYQRALQIDPQNPNVLEALHRIGPPRP